jgi:eukaryotic-like serine/threonine-protein kinase
MIGKTISHYKILDKLGAGGMGVVYKAHDTRLDRTVALKFLPPHLTKSDEDKQRFIREAKAAAALNHPHICTIYSVEEYEEQQFISMEFIDGTTIRWQLETKNPKPGTAIDYAIQIAEALTEAHEKGIVHRDIKPENIMVDSKNRIKVMDFGLAKLKGTGNLTKAGSTVGTMAYMSPEQIQGQDVDHRSDIFSFGVMLYEMLTGQTPFRGEHEAAMMYSIVNEAATPISDYLPDAHGDLYHILDRLLEKTPEERYQSAADVLTELKRLKRKTSSKQIPVSSAPSSKDRSHTVPAATEREEEMSQPKRSTSVTITIPEFGKRKAVIAIGIGVAALIVVAYWFFSTPSTPVFEDRSLAVLPLENLSPDPEDVFFADGIHEDIITHLSTIGDLRVITRGSVMRYTDTPRDYRAIAGDLGVTALLEGTVRRLGDRVRVSVQLIEADTERNLWAGTYDKDLDDIFEIQRELSREIADALHASLTPQELERLEKLPTENTEAYNFYVQAREYLSRPGYSPDNWESAIQLLERSIEHDPQFAHAYAGLSFVHAAMYWFAADRSRERIDKAGEMVERALMLNPDLPEAHMAKGNYLYWGHREYERALEHLNIALESMPNNSELHSVIGAIHRRLGNWELGIEQFKKAIELDPRNANHYQQLAHQYMRMRNFSEAARVAERQIELAPDSPIEFTRGQIYFAWHGTLDTLRSIFKGYDDPVERSAGWWLYINYMERNWDEALRAGEGLSGLFDTQTVVLPNEFFIGLTLTRINKIEEAREQFEIAREIMEDLRNENPDDPRIHVGLGRVYAELGLVEDAKREGEKATELVPIERDALDGAEFQRELAVIYATVGETEKALDTIYMLLSMPSNLTRNELKINPEWDPLRDHPRFQEIIENEN